MRGLLRVPESNSPLDNTAVHPESYGAAEKLLATQPNLSKAIRDLERELKVELFCRNNRGAVLTEAGRRLYQHAGTIMDQMAMIENLGKETAPRSLSIASYPSVMMGQLLGRFYRRHPELSLQKNSISSSSRQKYDASQTPSPPTTPSRKCLTICCGIS